MTADRGMPAFHLYAELPSGKQLVPGDVLSCRGRTRSVPVHWPRLRLGAHAPAQPGTMTELNRGASRSAPTPLCAQ